MKRNKYLILLPFVAILMVGCAGKSASVGNGAAVSSAMSADYVVLSPKSVANNISVTGTLMPGESAMLSAQTSGLVKQIYFKEGQRVTLGQLLVKLDDRQWLAQRQKLDAQLAMAEKDLARKQQLLDIKGISQAEVDDAALLISSIEADKKELDVMIDYAAIRAPFSGLVGLRSVSPGAYLAAGSPVARLVQVDPLKLEFSVPEQYAGQVKKGQLLRFSISGNDSVFLGTVYALEPVITETTRALRVRANVPNGQGGLVAGAFAEVTLALDSIHAALLLPTEAVVPKLNEQVVYQIRNGKVSEVSVKTGVRLPRLLQIEQGLADGDTIMVSGLLQAKVGQPVLPGKETSIQLLDK